MYVPTFPYVHFSAPAAFAGSWEFMSVALLVAGFLAMAALVAWEARHFSRHARNWRTARDLYGRIRGGVFAAPAPMLSYLRKIDPFVFEELVLFAFRRCGYSIRRNKRYTGDGGVDGRMSRDGRKYLLQMKRYSGNISLGHVKEFSEICRRAGKVGVFVHTGRTGDAVRGFAAERGGMYVISGDSLVRLLRDGEDVLKTDFYQKRISNIR